MLDEELLDDAERLARSDPSSLLRAVAAAGAQVRTGSYLAREAGVGRLSGAERTRAVLVLGCGQASLAGDLVVALGRPAAPAPVVTLPDPQSLPTWVGVADTVLAVSHTGDEDTMLACLDEAARRGAAVIGVGPENTSLENVCTRFRGVFVPAAVGWPPRARLWSLATPVLLVAAALRLVAVDDRELDATADLLDRVAEQCQLAHESFVNPAKTLALELASSAPVVWGTSPIAAVAARRFAAQLAGCAATPALWGQLPGTVEEFGGVLDAPGGDESDLFRDRVEEPEERRVRLLLLRDPGESPPAAESAGVVRGSADRHGLPVTELQAHGDGPTQRFASLVALADFASVYLGLASGIDPAGERTGAADPRMERR